MKGTPTLSRAFFVAVVMLLDCAEVVCSSGAGAASAAPAAPTVPRPPPQWQLQVSRGTFALPNIPMLEDGEAIMAGSGTEEQRTTTDSATSVTMVVPVGSADAIGSTHNDIILPAPAAEFVREDVSGSGSADDGSASAPDKSEVEHSLFDLSPSELEDFAQRCARSCPDLAFGICFVDNSLAWVALRSDMRQQCVNSSICAHLFLWRCC